MTAPSAGASRAVALVEVARPTEGQRRGLARLTVGQSVRVVTGSGLSLRLIVRSQMDVPTSTTLFSGNDLGASQKPHLRWLRSHSGSRR
jgi:hypothetical protein